jgi:hypothetical protein
MPARNDASAVKKAAKAVDRTDVMTLLRDALHVRLPKEAPKVGWGDIRKDNRAAVPIGDPRSGFGEDGELRVGGGRASPQSPLGGRRRSPRRTDYSTRMRKVVLRPYGKWPRYGTARAAKTEVVRTKLKEREGQETLVRHLLGLFYEHEGKSGAITFHDLEVMEGKSLITIKPEGE